MSQKTLLDFFAKKEDLTSRKRSKLGGPDTNAESDQPLPKKGEIYYKLSNCSHQL